jgi:hypothetical protein
MNVRNFHEDLVLRTYQVNFSPYSGSGHALENILLPHERGMILNCFGIQGPLIVNNAEAYRQGQIL